MYMYIFSIIISTLCFSSPVLMFLQESIPELFRADLKNTKAVQDWLVQEVQADEIERIELKLLKKIVKTGNTIAVIFSAGEDHGVSGIHSIHSMSKTLDVPIVHIVGYAGPQMLGVEDLPALVYYENKVPAIYEGSLAKTDEANDWIMEQRTADTIEEVTEEILQTLIQDVEYVAVVFTGPCDEAARNTECEEILEELETVDDEIDDYGIVFVTTEDIKFAGNELKLRVFPALGIFRNGQFLLYEGNLYDPEVALSWIIDKDTLKIKDQIEEVGEKMLGKVLNDDKDVLTFFYKEEYLDKLKPVFRVLETIDDELEKKGIEFVKCSDENIKDTYALNKIPSLVYFENKIPIEFDGKLNDGKDIRAWFNEELESMLIRTVDEDTLERLVETSDDIFAIFYDSKKKKQRKFMDGIDTIDDEAEKLEIFMVKVDDPVTARHYGLYQLPAVIYFEDGIPNIYEGAQSPRAILNWLEEQKTSNGIEEVNGVLLDRLIKEEEYVAAVFLSECIDDDKLVCDELIENLEEIDDELDKIDILLVKLDEPQYAKVHKIKTFPTIGLFRNGDLAIYDGKVGEAMSVMKWLTDLDNLKIEGQIEEVGIPLLEMLIDKETNIFSLLYDEGDRRAAKIIKEMESIDDNLENDKVVLVKCSDEGVDDHFGIGYLPRLVYFENGIPEMYPGAEVNAAEVLKWIALKLSESKLKLVSRAVVETLIIKREHIGIFFINDDKEGGHKVLKDIEDDIYTLETEELAFILVDEPEFAEELGLELPSLIHFTEQIPNVFRGDLESKETIIQWLIDNKEESSIEKVTVQILEELIEDEEYIAVLYTGSCKEYENVCEEVLEFLENVDDELDDKGIAFVQTDNEDFPLIKHHISKFPALAFFRNGNPIVYDGKIEDEEEVPKWLNDDRNLMISGTIEEVNEELLAHLYETQDDLVVFFYEEEDRDADEIIEGLEVIDSDLEEKGFSMVKTCDEGIEVQYGIVGLPKVVYFQRGVPIISDNDLMEEKTVLNWIKKMSSTNAIHKVSDVVLDGLIKKFDHIAVVFYSAKNVTVVKNLNDIVDDCAENDIAMVRIDDKDEAMSYGLDEIPALMFFNFQVPSIYTEDMNDSSDIFNWILKNQASSVIEEVSDEVLENLIEDHEYVSVFFRGSCDEENEDCDAILARLESVDDNLDEIGVLLVTTKDTKVAKEHGLIALPALGMFR